MNPTELHSMISFWADRFSAHGPPLIRRPRSAGSRFSRETVVRADPPMKIDRYTHGLPIVNGPRGDEEQQTHDDGEDDESEPRLGDEVLHGGSRSDPK